MQTMYTLETSPDVKRGENGEVTSWLVGVDADGFAVYRILFDL